MAAWGRMRELHEKRPEVIAWVLDEVRDRGPLTAGEIEEDAPVRKDNWGWNWSDAKAALEWLFWTGQVTTAGRNAGFARVYDLTERVLPSSVVQTPTPDEADAHRELVRVAARALGVAAEIELRDYFRLPVAGARRAVAELVEAGELRPVTVQGWRQRAYLHAERDAAPLGPGGHPGQPVRPADLGARPDRAAVRLPLPDRDLHAARPARPRVLRAAVPARRRAGGPGRPQGRPAGRRAARARRCGSSRATRSTTSRGRWPTSLFELAGWLGLGEVVPPVPENPLALAVSAALAAGALGGWYAAGRRRVTV